MYRGSVPIPTTRNWRDTGSHRGRTSSTEVTATTPAALVRRAVDEQSAEVAAEGTGVTTVSVSAAEVAHVPADDPGSTKVGPVRPIEEECLPD